MANAEQALPRAFDVIVYGASGFTGPPGAVRISRASALIFVAVISVPLIPAAERTRRLRLTSARAGSLRSDNAW